MVVTEAMEAGLPVLGFKNSPGVNEMIIDNYNGFLVGSIKEYTEKLDLLTANYDIRNKMALQSHKSVENLSNGEVWSRWEYVMKQLIDRYNYKKVR